MRVREGEVGVSPRVNFLDRHAIIFSFYLLLIFFFLALFVVLCIISYFNRSFFFFHTSCFSFTQFLSLSLSLSLCVYMRVHVHGRFMLFLFSRFLSHRARFYFKLHETALKTSGIECAKAWNREREKKREKKKRAIIPSVNGDEGKETNINNKRK